MMQQKRWSCDVGTAGVAIAKPTRARNGARVIEDDKGTLPTGACIRDRHAAPQPIENTMTTCAPGPDEAADTRNTDLLIAIEQALAERVARATGHARDCILMAVVTTSALSGELIDLAVRYSDAARRVDENATISGRDVQKRDEN